MKLNPEGEGRVLGLETVGRLPAGGGVARGDIRQREWRAKAQRQDGKARFRDRWSIMGDESGSKS